MSGENIIFNDEKINKGNVFRNKKSFLTDDVIVNKILISEKNLLVITAHLNTSLDIMMMISLEL